MVTSLILLASMVAVAAEVCPCGNPDFCQPIVSKVKPSKEVFMFALRNTPREQYVLYDWDKITTIALTKYVDDDLICYGHSKNTKVVLMVQFSGDSLLNKTWMADWVSRMNKTVIEHRMDGAHLDFEDFIELDDVVKRHALYDAFVSLAKSLRTYHPDMQVTIDFDADPLVPHHWYGDAGLAQVADFIFLRTYDQRRWVVPPDHCRAWASDANNVTIQGLKNYEFLGIPANKIILGFAWYGFDYKCEYLSETDVCSIALSHGRCTVAGAKTHTYAYIVENLFQKAVGGPKRDEESGAPYLNYKDTDNGEWRQVWYNDPTSLRIRYPLANKYSLRGVGAWVLPDLDYTNSTLGKHIRRSMFDALPDWKKRM